MARHVVPCAFCEAPATHLCDFAHCWSSWGDDVDSKGRPRRVMEMDGEPLTCDAPICDACRTQEGIKFDVYGKGTLESYDYCPVHQGLNRGTLQEMGELTKGQVEQRRLRDWKFRYLQRTKAPAGTPSPQITLDL